MPQQKLKNESYQNFGGINSKVSPYQVGPMEFLDLTNLDFQTPGSLTQRWGSTQYIGATSTFPGAVTGLHEFTKTNGFSQLIVGFTGALISQAGSSITALGSGAIAAAPSNTFKLQVAVWNGSIWLSSVTGEPNYWLGRVENYFDGQGATAAVYASEIGSNQFDAVTFQNLTFITTGQGFFKYDGMTLFRFGIPYPSRSFAWTVQGATTGYPYGLNTGYVYNIAACFETVSGSQGPLSPVYILNNNAPGQRVIIDNAEIDLFDGYGINKMHIYLARQGSSLGYGYDNQSTSAWNQTYYFFKSYDVTIGSTQVTGIELGGSASEPQTYTNANSREVADRLVFGTTFIPQLSGGSNKGLLYYYSVAPRALEVYQNHLFLAGFDANPSIAYFSNLGAPEEFEPDNNFEVRTNDGDRITCLKNYAATSRLMIFKDKSTHVLTGDSADSFALTEASSEYGCINNRSAVTYDNYLAFLDRKGVIEYNGAQFGILSYKIQPLIDQINFAAAVTTACFAHDKRRNQIMLSVPTNGATLNNTTLVYDYIAKAWTKYEGIQPSAYALVQGSLTNPAVMFGGYSGSVSYFGASFRSDNGVGFTVGFQTRYLSDLGQSVTKQFRRLYLNCDADQSATLAINIEFLQDYGSSTVLSRTMYNTPFQNRIDYGIPAKSLSFKAWKFSPTISIRVHGFAVDYRYQRNT